MDNIKYWVWLTNLPNMLPEKITALLEHFGSVEEIYNASPEAYTGIYGIGKREIMSLSYKDLQNAEKILYRTEETGARIITFESAEYPPMLREISAPPYVLYAKGKQLPWADLFMIGVVGTRKCTEYGESAARDICYELAAAGVTVVSGMARGIDTCAAKAALRAGGDTVAVLGCGIDVVYPPENKDLMDEIAKHGVVLTEYPPLSRPERHHFPVRNRIISGLSRGILVAEAPVHSGALITANYAYNSGKDIFSVPGSIYKENCAGTNHLIQRGAKLTTCAADILTEYPDAETFRPAETKPAPAVPQVTPETVLEDSRYQDLSEAEQRIVVLLAAKNMHIDELVRQTDTPASTLNPMLAMMEMMGYIRKLPGNQYKLNL